MRQNVVKLVPAPARRDRDLARQAASLLAQIEHTAMTPALRQMIDNACTRVQMDAEPQDTWPGGYTMINVQQTSIVWDAIRELPASKRPAEVRHLFDIALANLRWDTGEVMLRRDQIAERMKCAPREVSKAMTLLCDWGVMRRETVRVEGMRGRGIVTYFLNPHVAWRGSLTGRADQAQQIPQPAGPLLRIMEGGKV
jgi:hypothetical protein